MSLVGVAGRPADLGRISAAIHHGCMGLPQELINYIMDMLHGDLCALKACSLTCKAMFASTRHLIHRIFCLTVRNNQSVLTKAEKSRYQKPDSHEIELRFISYMGERGLLQYARHVHIRVFRTFTPDALSPHLHHFQSLDLVHTLTIEHYDAAAWKNHYKTSFVHFYPALTSLTLRRASGQYQSLLPFILQFPNLENLCLEWLIGPRNSRTVPTIIDQFPPLCGHLRLAGYSTVVRWLTDAIHEVPNVINFRSVELEDFSGVDARHLLEACANTLENLTIIPRANGTH